MVSYHPLDFGVEWNQDGKLLWHDPVGFDDDHIGLEEVNFPIDAVVVFHLHQLSGNFTGEIECIADKLG